MNGHDVDKWNNCLQMSEKFGLKIKTQEENLILYGGEMPHHHFYVTCVPSVNDLYYFLCGYARGKSSSDKGDSPLGDGGSC